jgi:hypothetical protein
MEQSMSGIQYQSLSDDEFARQIQAIIDKAGVLPSEVIVELAYRVDSGGRDKEHERARTNPNQLPLPFNE